jgi:hypothetical protein
MNEPPKPPSWYRRQAAETRDIATLVNGVDRADLLGLAARWETLAKLVVEGEVDSPAPTRGGNVIELAAYRRRRRLGGSR